MIQQSLKDNLAEIKASLPEEFHADLEKQIAAATDYVAPSAEEQGEAIKAELKANPDVDDAAVIPSLDINAHLAPSAPSKEEQENEMKAALAEVQKNIQG